MWYHGNGMTLEGFTVGFASPKPYMFSECGMSSRIARRLLENRSDVTQHFASVPHPGHAPDDVRIRIYDHDGQLFDGMEWSPGAWERWLPCAETYSWDAYQCRLWDKAFMDAVQQMRAWCRTTETDGGEEEDEAKAIVVRYISTYDGERSGFAEVRITPATVAALWATDFAPTRENRFVATYLTWLLVHDVLKPWPDERSWFELSLVAHTILLRGQVATLPALRGGKNSKEKMPAGQRLQKGYAQAASQVWRSLYPLQWAQTSRTLRKLLRFDQFNTGAKLPIKGAGVLQYPGLFVPGFVKSTQLAAYRESRGKGSGGGKKNGGEASYTSTMKKDE